MLVAFLALLLVFRQRLYFYYITTSFAISTTLIQIVILCYLRAKLTKLNCHKHLLSAINTIYAQSGVFIGVYAIIVAFNVLRLVTKDSTEVNFVIGLSILNLVIKEFCFQIPIIYNMYLHLSTLEINEEP